MIALKIIVLYALTARWDESRDRVHRHSVTGFLDSGRPRVVVRGGRLGDRETEHAPRSYRVALRATRGNRRPPNGGAPELLTKETP